MIKPLPDEAARERVRTRLDQDFLVEAGAGTGKTRLLVDRIENLVASGKARLRSVVAITFTEKAAAELRVALRQRVEARLRDPAPELRELFRTALVDLEIAFVSTIHAFAADLLRERPVEAGVDPQFAVADELQASLFRTEAWDRWLEKQKDAAPEPLREAIEHGVSLAALRTLGDEMLRYRDVLDRDLDRGRSPEDPLTWLRAASRTIRGCIAQISKDCFDHTDKAVTDLENLGHTLDLYERLADIEVRRSLLGGELKLKIGGRAGNWKTGTLSRIKDHLAGLQVDLEALRRAHGHRLAAGAVNWLRGYVREYQALKAREGILDFDDLLLIARNMLRDNREVRRDFQQRFDAILIDEFQDTDPLQAEIIFFLAEDGPATTQWTDVRLAPGKLFIVGDPKQSIYAFRRADIETYELAKDVLTKSGTVEYITANFRSVSEILDAVNDAFKTTMTVPPDGKYQPKYVPLEPSMKTRSGASTPALIFFYPDLKVDPGEPKDVLRRVEADGLAAFLRRAIDQDEWKVGAEHWPARFGDIALLFRGMSDVPIYEEALKRYEIPYRVTSSRTFYKREEIGWLLNVLHAVEHPTDPVAVWGALRSPLFGCSDREIYEFVSAAGSLDYRGNAENQRPPAGPAAGPGIASAYDVLRQLHAQRNFWSVPRMVEEVLARTHGLATFLLTPQGEQRVANLEKVVTLARALEESGILTFRAFVHWLRDMEEQAVDEAESPTVEEGDDVVRIMSIHAAKGLEFPVVIIPDLARGAGGGADHVLLHRVTRTFAVYLGKVGQGWPVQTGNFEDLKHAQDRRDAAERLRVLYVAMTRAKDVLMLPVFPTRPTGTMMADLAHALPLTPDFRRRHRGWNLVDGSKIQRVTDDPAPVRLQIPAGPTDEGETIRVERETWLSARKAGLGSAGTPDRVVIPSGLVDQAKLKVLKRRAVRLESSRGGRPLGSLVHEVLATIPLDRADRAAEYVRYFANKRGMNEPAIGRAISLIQAALGSEVVRPAPGARSWREVPFAMETPDGIIEGSIDLVILADGVTVLDFKTDAADAGKEPELEAFYVPQLESYVQVMKRVGVDNVTSRLVFLRSAP